MYPVLKKIIINSGSQFLGYRLKVPAVGAGLTKTSLSRSFPQPDPVTPLPFWTAALCPCNTPTCLCSRHLASANPCLESVSPLHGALASPPSGTILILHACTQNIHKHTCLHTTQPPHILCTQKSMYRWSEFCSHF